MLVQTDTVTGFHIELVATKGLLASMEGLGHVVIGDLDGTGRLISSGLLWVEESFNLSPNSTIVARPRDFYRANSLLRAPTLRHQTYYDTYRGYMGTVNEEFRLVVPRVTIVLDDNFYYEHGDYVSENGRVMTTQGEFFANAIPMYHNQADTRLGIYENMKRGYVPVRVKSYFPHNTIIVVLVHSDIISSYFQGFNTLIPYKG